MNRISKIKFLCMTIIGCLIFASNLGGQAVPSPTLTSICAKYTNAVAKIATDVAISNDVAIAWYGENLEILATCRKNVADSDGFDIVKQETKRFKVERMVPTNNVPALVAKAVTEYQTKITAIEAESARRKSDLLGFYITALNRLSIELMEKGKEKDVEIVKKTRIEAEALLVQLRSGKPMSDKPSVKEPAVSADPVISVNPPAPVMPTNIVVAVTPEKPIVPPQPKMPVKVITAVVPVKVVTLKKETSSLTDSVPKKLRDLNSKETENQDLSTLSLGSPVVLSGPQEADETRLTKMKNYLLRGSYSVPEGKTLIVEAGTIVKAEQDAFLQVFGNLRVEGSESAPVIFYGEKAVAGYWKGILGNPQSASFEYAVLRDADSAIRLPKGTIKNCLIMGNNWGAVSENSPVYGNSGKNLRVFENCIFEKNLKGAIRSDFTTTKIDNCTIRENGSNPSEKGDLAWRGAVFGSANGRIIMRKSIVSDNEDIGVNDYRHNSLVEDCIVENNKPFDFSVTESNLQVNNCWMGETVQRVIDQKGYGANLANVRDLHDGRQGSVVFKPGPKTRPVDCGAKLNLKVKGSKEIKPLSSGFKNR